MKNKKQNKNKKQKKYLKRKIEYSILDYNSFELESLIPAKMRLALILGFISATLIIFDSRTRIANFIMPRITNKPIPLIKPPPVMINHSQNHTLIGGIMMHERMIHTVKSRMYYNFTAAFTMNSPPYCDYTVIFYYPAVSLYKTPYSYTSCDQTTSGIVSIVRAVAHTGDEFKYRIYTDNTCQGNAVMTVKFNIREIPMQ